MKTKMKSKMNEKWMKKANCEQPCILSLTQNSVTMAILNAMILVFSSEGQCYWAIQFSKYFLLLDIPIAIFNATV
jgi:hypothetical protein